MSRGSTSRTFNPASDFEQPGAQQRLLPRWAPDLGNYVSQGTVSRLIATDGRHTRGPARGRAPTLAVAQSTAWRRSASRSAAPPSSRSRDSRRTRQAPGLRHAAQNAAVRSNLVTLSLMPFALSRVVKSSPLVVWPGFTLVSTSVLFSTRVPLASTASQSHW